MSCLALDARRRECLAALARSAVHALLQLLDLAPQPLVLLERCVLCGPASRVVNAGSSREAGACELAVSPARLSCWACCCVSLVSRAFSLLSPCGMHELGWRAVLLAAKGKRGRRGRRKHMGAQAHARR